MGDGKKIHWISSILIVSFLLTAAIMAFAGAKGGGEYDDFAACLADSGLTFYGTDWCGHCQDQKEMFGDSFEFVDFVNCDFEGDICNEIGIVGYPTWAKDGEIVAMGSQTFDALAGISGCEY